MNSTRFAIAALMFAIVNAVLFGVGLITVLTIPAFAAHAMTLIPAVAAASFIFAAPISWMLAPRLRARWASHRIS